MTVSSFRIRRRIALLVFLGSAACYGSDAYAAPATSSAQWVLSYEGKSTNRFIWDKRTKQLIRAQVPGTLSGDLLDALGGPPDPVFVLERRYVSVAACVPHSCPDKGFFWTDAKSGVGLGAYFSTGVLRLGSVSLSPDQLPDAAQRALVDWLSEYQLAPEKIEFVPGSGEVQLLPSTQFVARKKYEPPETGPSFDCAKAVTSIERTICSTPSLAAQDLELSELVQRIRQGHDTVGARRQLLDLQREWLKTRNATCRDIADMPGCLSDQYRTQYDRLSNWIPTH